MSGAGAAREPYVGAGGNHGESRAEGGGAAFELGFRTASPPAMAPTKVGLTPAG